MEKSLETLTQKVNDLANQVISLVPFAGYLYRGDKHMTHRPLRTPPYHGVGDSLDAVGRSKHTCAPVVVGLLRSLFVWSLALPHAKLGIFLGLDASLLHSCSCIEASRFEGSGSEASRFETSRLLSLWAGNHQIWN